MKALLHRVAAQLERRYHPLCHPTKSNMVEPRENNKFVVLLLKAKNQDDAYEKLLREHGYVPVFIPVLSFQFTNKQELTECLEKPENHGGLIFTSQRAVEAVYSCITDNNFAEKWRISLKEKWLGVPVFVTGKATAKFVREKLELCDIFGEDSGSGEALTSVILDKLPRGMSKALLFPCANIKKEVLPKRLGQEGYNLHCLTAYHTQADPNLLKNLQERFSQNDYVGQPNCIVFFSPSGVGFSHEALKQTIASFYKAKLLAIGQSTATGLKDHGLLVSAVAKQPNPPCLLEVVDSCFKEQK